MVVQSRRPIVADADLAEHVRHVRRARELEVRAGRRRGRLEGLHVGCERLQIDLAVSGQREQVRDRVEVG